MSSFIRGLGGGIGRVFGRVIAIIIVGVIGYFVLNSLNFDLWDFISSRILMTAKAQTQNRDMSNMIYSGSFTPCGLSYNKYCVQTNNNQTLTRSLNTTYNGVLLDISFSWQETMSSQSIITINGMSTDFRNNGFSCNVWGSSQQDTYGTLMSSASCSFISKSKIQVVIPQNSYSYHTIHIWGSPLTGVSNYGVKSIVETWDDGQQDLSSITDNATQNTQDIIDNANSNTETIINSIGGLFNTCTQDVKILTINDIYYDDSYLTSNGTIDASGGYGVSDYVPIHANATYNLSSNDGTPNNVYFCIYTTSKSLVSCTKYNQQTLWNFTTSENDGYMRFTIKDNISYVLRLLSEEECINKLDENNWWQQQIKEEINSTNSTIKDDNIDNGLGSSFFNDFQDNDFGLSSIVTLPITTIQSLTSQSCVALELPVPFTNNGRITLPCMSQVYQSKVPQLYTLWQVVCYGLIGYWIGTDIFRLVKSFKNPDEDKVEVMDL